MAQNLSLNGVTVPSTSSLRQLRSRLDGLGANRWPLSARQRLATVEATDFVLRYNEKHPPRMRSLVIHGLGRFKAKQLPSELTEVQRSNPVPHSRNLVRKCANRAGKPG